MHLGRPTVVIVDDDSDTQCTFASWLNDAGYSCLTTDDGPMALWYARRLAAVAAVVDVGQRRERLRLAGSLAHESPTTGVVVTSAAKAHTALPQPWPAGVCCHLVKPAVPADVVDAVNRASAMRQKEAAMARVAESALQSTIAARQRRLGDAIAHAPTPEAAYTALRHTFGSRVPTLFAHSRRVAQTAQQLAAALFLPSDAALHVIGAALLHDIGKLTLPESVLHGEAPLGDAEIEALGNHHDRTLGLLARARALAPVRQIVEHVQARWDGTGVPWGLAGQDISIGARIVAIADAVDTARGRDGAAAWPGDASYTALYRGAGTRLDPDLVRVCLHTLDSADAMLKPSTRRGVGVKCS